MIKKDRLFEVIFLLFKLDEKFGSSAFNENLNKMRFAIAQTKKGTIENQKQINRIDG